jgi:hypothetical protein
VEIGATDASMRNPDEHVVDAERGFGDV